MCVCVCVYVHPCVCVRVFINVPVLFVCLCCVSTAVTLPVTQCLVTFINQVQVRVCRQRVQLLADLCVLLGVTLVPLEL